MESPERTPVGAQARVDGGTSEVRPASGTRLWAEIAGGPAGRVVHTGADDIRVRFEREPPEERLGAHVTLTLHGGPLGAPVPLRASITSRDDNDAVEYGFTVRDPARLARLLPPVAGVPHCRRRELRLAPQGAGAWVTVVAMEGPSTGRRLGGVLLDVSAHGLGLLLDLAAEEALSTSPTVICTYAGPGRTGRKVRGARIVNRALIGPQVRYGLAFEEPEEGVPTAMVEAYEPAWDCSPCGTRLLLATSHRCCPGCGRARGAAPTYFPDWDEAELNTEHWASGDDRPCPFCAASFSDLAAFCGRCGRPLA